MQSFNSLNHYLVIYHEELHDDVIFTTKKRLMLQIFQDENMYTILLGTIIHSTDSELELRRGVNCD